MKTHWEMKIILQYNDLWITIYNNTFVTENKFFLFCTPIKIEVSVVSRSSWQAKSSTQSMLGVLWPWGKQNNSCGAPPWVSDGDPRAGVSDIPPCSHSRDVGKGKTPSLDKEVWGTEGLTAGGSWKGHQQNKKDKMQQNQKINWDGKCLKLVKKVFLWTWIYLQILLWNDRYT